jgi:uncharacterized protein (TIRG00374 family)
VTENGSEGPGRPGRLRRLVPKHPFRRGVLLVLLALVVEYLILPQIAGVNHALHLLGRVNLGFVAIGIVLEVGALASYAQLTRAVLPPGASSFSRIWRIDLSTLAVSHVLPGGTAGGDGLAYKLLLNEGVSGSDAAFALATQGIGSALVLNAILWLALIVSIPLTGFNPLYGTAAAIGGVVFAVFAAAVFLLTKGEDRAASVLGSVAARLPLLKQDAVDRLVHSLADRIRTMAAEPALLRRAVGWATLNWLLDAAALFVFLAAFGHVENPDGLLVAYGLANVLAAIPVTPGGLGIVEGVLVPSLVGFGSPRGVAVLGVVAYRLLNFWLPIPVGAGAYLSLGRSSEAVRRRRAETLKQAVAEAASSRRPGGPGSALGGTGQAG